MTNNMIDTAWEEETLTSADVKEFLRSKQEPFLRALYEFAQKCGRGFAQYKINDEGLVIEKIESTEDNPEAEFNLNGLCEIASLAIGLALKELFGEKVGVDLLFVFTSNTDAIAKNELMGEPQDGRWLMAHVLLRYWVEGEDESMSVDATYKQFQYRVKFGQYMMIFPSRAEKFMYPQKFPLESRSKLSDIPNTLKNVEGEMSRGDYGNATIEDLYALVRAIVQ
jgi:hypothetical protein